MSGRDKPRIREAVVVEGRYDKNTIAQVVDALILETSGFGIFKDEERLVLLRRLAAERGLLISSILCIISFSVSVNQYYRWEQISSSRPSRVMVPYPAGSSRWSPLSTGVPSSAPRPSRTLILTKGASQSRCQRPSSTARYTV